jgi:hypothetical protein
MQVINNMKKVFLLNIVLVAAFFLMVVPSAWSTSYFFDSTGGLDTNNGTTSTTPWQTIDKLNDLFQGLNGVPAIACGDNVFLRRGRTWTANDTSDRILINQKNCTTGARIKIDAYDSGADPILNHEAITNTWAVRVQRSAWIEFRNLDVRGGIIGVAFEGVTDSVFMDGAVRNVQQQCVHMRRASTTTAGTNTARITFENNTVTNCGVSGLANGEAIYMGVDNLQLEGSTDDNSGPITIRRNVLSITTHEGIEAKQGLLSPLIEYNHINNTNSAGDANNAGAISIQDRGSGSIIRYNLVVSALGAGGECIRVRSASQIFRNIINGCTHEGIRVTDPAGTDPLITVYNNTIYNAAEAAILIEANPNATFKNNIGWSNLVGTNTSTSYFNDTSDPLFVNVATNDFNLLAGSPALNSGTACIGLFNGASCDRGALEAPLDASAVKPASANAIDITWTNNLFSPLSSVDHTKCSVVQNGISLTETTASVISTNTTRHPVTQTLTGGTLTITCVYGAVTDSADIGGSLGGKSMGFDVPLSASTSVIRYAVPTGGQTTGTCTSSGTGTNGACTITQLINQCVAGDICLLRNGTYSATTMTTIRDGTAGNPITFRAENPHKAIVVCCGTGFSWIFHKKHKFITLQDIVFDGNKATATALIRISPVVGTLAGTVITDSIVEGNIIRNGGGAAINYQQVNGGIFRWNTIDSMGWQGPGEGLYLSTTTDTDTHLIAHNIQCYSNRIRATTQNAVDYKDFTSNVDCHHNVLENHEHSSDRPPFTYANDGIIRSEGSAAVTGNLFRDSIVRNSLESGNGSIMRLRIRLDVKDSVFYNITSTSNTESTGSTANPHQVTNNIFCGTNSDITTFVTTGTAVFTGSLFNRPQGECDTRAAIILAALKTQAGSPALRWTGPVFNSAGTVSTTKIQILFANNNFPPIKSPDHTKCTVTEGGVARAVSAGTIVGTNILELTTAAMGSGALVLTCAAGAVEDSANIVNQDVNVDSAAFVASATNNNPGGGGGPTNFVITQSNFRFYNSRVGVGNIIEPVASLNTNREVIPGASFIFIGQLDVTIAAPPTFAVALRYSKNGGAYLPVPTDFNADNIRAYGTVDISGTVIADNTPLPTCLAGVFSNVEGTIQRTANAVPNITLGINECIPFGVVIQFDEDAIPSTDIYKFRLYNQDGTPFIYTDDKTGQITIMPHMANGA